MIDLDLTTGKSLVIVAFVFVLLVLLIFASTMTAVLLGAAVVGLVLAVLYYSGVRLDRWARGGNGGAY